MSQKIQLRMHRFELTYEAALSRAVPAVIDTRGQVVSALLSQFDEFGLRLSDVNLDQGSLDEEGLSCEIEKCDTSISLRVDRLEIRFSAIEESGDETAADIIRKMWRILTELSPETTARSHSLFFEIDCEILDISYRDAIERYCRPHQNLPKATESAVVYYLPRDGSHGFLDSSLVINRSDELDGGVLIAATLVFDGASLSPDSSVHAGRARLNDLLGRIDLELLK